MTDQRSVEQETALNLHWISDLINMDAPRQVILTSLCMVTFVVAVFVLMISVHLPCGHHEMHADTVALSLPFLHEQKMIESAIKA